MGFTYRHNASAVPMDNELAPAIGSRKNGWDYTDVPTNTACPKDLTGHCTCYAREGWGKCCACGAHSSHWSAADYSFAKDQTSTINFAGSFERWSDDAKDPFNENGESILQEAHRLTHGDRNQTYGHPADDYARTAALFSALIAHKLREPISAMEMALGMVCVKLSRQMAHPKRDNCTDGAGYFWVAQMCAQRNEEK